MDVGKTDTCYSSAVSLRSTQIVIFIAELKNLRLCTDDIENNYHEKYTDEKVCFIIGGTSTIHMWRKSSFGKYVMISTFEDTSLMYDMITDFSCTGIIHLLSKTPNAWFSK
jgi:hypothetical protein